MLPGLDGRYVQPGRSELPDAVEGVIIGGGDDIEPEHYGLTGDAGATYDKERDDLEIDILRRALRSNIPIMGICRGSQLINVVLGGGLFQDIRPQRKMTPNKNSIFPIKVASVKSDSLLYKILGRTEVKINSLHNQAVDRIADGLKASAHDADGFVQAIECDDNSRYIVGVQWHPEYMPYSFTQRKLFKQFAAAVVSSDNILKGDASEEL